ncbi:MAG TPA: hypothetical protein EYP56_22635 [Planctomycetaceae bacterium]|nr:hypothetical protein [Planctomycetaceae bacterium]
MVRARRTADRFGGVTETVYDSRGQVVQTTDPLGWVNDTVYGGKGRAIWTDDAHLPGESAAGTRLLRRGRASCPDRTLRRCGHHAGGRSALAGGQTGRARPLLARSRPTNHPFSDRHYRLDGLGDISPEELVMVVEKTICPDTWQSAGGPGAIETLPGCLVVTQTQEVHERVADLFQQLSAVEPYWQQSVLELINGVEAAGYSVAGSTRISSRGRFGTWCTLS